VLNVDDFWQTLHDSGGRLFFLGNTPPQGCNPAQLTQFANHSKDSLGCIDDINAINRAYGVALQQVVTQLQANYTDSLIYLFDSYNASVEIFTNPATYGKNSITKSSIISCIGYLTPEYLNGQK